MVAQRLLHGCPEVVAWLPRGCCMVAQRLLDTLKGTYVYRYAAKFCRVSE